MAADEVVIEGQVLFDHVEIVEIVADRDAGIVDKGNRSIRGYVDRMLARF